MKLLNSKVRSIYVSLDDGVPVAGSVWAPVGRPGPSAMRDPLRESRGCFWLTVDAQQEAVGRI